MSELPTTCVMVTRSPLSARTRAMYASAAVASTSERV